MAMASAVRRREASNGAMTLIPDDLDGHWTWLLGEMSDYSTLLPDWLNGFSRTPYVEQGEEASEEGTWVLWTHDARDLDLFRRAAPLVQRAMAFVHDFPDWSLEDVRMIHRENDVYVNVKRGRNLWDQANLQELSRELDNVLLRMREENVAGSVPVEEVDGFLFSPIEADFYRELRHRELVFTPQCWLVHQGRPLYRVDFMVYYSGSAFAVELDGHDWHKTKEQRNRDTQRDRFLQARRIPTIRFTGSQVHQNLQGCMFELMDCLTGQKGLEV